MNRIESDAAIDGGTNSRLGEGTTTPTSRVGPFENVCMITLLLPTFRSGFRADIRSTVDRQTGGQTN